MTKKPVKKKPLRGKELMRAVLKQITKHPHTWRQSTWHCGTSHCFAGWAQVLGGRRPTLDAAYDAQVFLKLTDPQCDSLFSPWADKKRIVKFAEKYLAEKER